MPAVMTVRSSDRREPGEIRADGQRRLGLAQKERCGHVQRLGPARSHEPGHHPGEKAHDPLHQPEVVKHREERGDEDRPWAERERRRRRLPAHWHRPASGRRRTRRRPARSRASPPRRQRLSARPARRRARGARESRRPTASPAPRRPPCARWIAGSRTGSRPPPRSPPFPRTLWLDRPGRSGRRSRARSPSSTIAPARSGTRGARRPARAALGRVRHRAPPGESLAGLTEGFRRLVSLALARRAGTR